MSRVLAVIPARGGSSRIERKNMQLVGGMTLVERAWRCAVEAFGIEHVMVSTDDEDIVEVVKDWTKGVNDWKKRAGWCLRPERLHGDAPMAQVLLQAYECSDRWAERIVCVQPTTPQRTFRDLWRAADALAGASSVVTVHDDGEHRWVRNGAAYVTHLNMLHRGLVWSNPVVVETRPMVDINTPEDLERVRAIMG